MSIYSKKELADIIKSNINKTGRGLMEEADSVRQRAYGNKVFFRGLIEFTNYCDNNCFYCGIRKSNKGMHRYMLTNEEILACCKTGYKLGFRSFVLQGGEICGIESQITKIIYEIKSNYPDCSLTISVGEKNKEIYKEYFEAGADRYLLRHETADESHYKKLHPNSMSLKNRKKCLYDLKEIGFQIGAGFMVGSPFQTVDNLVADLLFLLELKPHMVGIGPFIPHNETPFKGYTPHNENEIAYICKAYAESEQTGQHYLLNASVTMVAITRLLLPDSLIPATTALATISVNGRELAIKAGANVVMPNVSPLKLRQNYAIYDNKAFMGCEAAESVSLSCESIKSIGYKPCFTRGDHVAFSEFYSKRLYQ